MERKIKKRMKKKVTAQKKSKKYHKLNRKMSWLDKVKLWLLQHSKIAFLLDSSIFFYQLLGYSISCLGQLLFQNPIKTSIMSFLSF